MKRLGVQVFFLLVISALLGFLANTFSAHPLTWIREPDPAREQWAVISTNEVYRHTQDGTAILLDARDPNEYEQGHLPGALNLPASQFGDAFSHIGESLPRDYPIIVYCQGGPCDESHEVLQQLKTFEFTDLYLYAGGWMEWSLQNLPVEQSEK